MKIIYSHATAYTEGSRVHARCFVKAFRDLGETVVENLRDIAPCVSALPRRSTAQQIKARASWIVESVKSFFVLILLICKERPDALLFRFSSANHYFFAICGLSFFYPVILEINALRSIEHFYKRPKASDFLDKLSLICAKGCFVVSEKLKQHITTHYRLNKKIEVIENGVDVNEFSPIVSGDEIKKTYAIEGRFIVGFVGSFQRWHGIDYLVDATELLVKSLPQAVIFLVGNGPDRVRCESRVKEKGLSKHFVFAGHVSHSEVKHYIAAMDVVIAPFSKESYAKGFYNSPLKLFEYMAMAKPVVAAPMGQIKEIVEDGISGYLVPSEETGRLVEVFLCLYNDKELRKRVGDNARARMIERYTWKINAEKVKQVIEWAIHA